MRIWTHLGGALRRTSRSVRRFIPSHARAAVIERLEGRRMLAAAPPVVTGLTLINARSDVALGQFVNGTTVDLGKVGRDLSVSAQTSAGNVGSVAFALDGKRLRVENGAPYAVAGDNGRNYYPWAPALGAHTLTVTPYPLANAAGAAGRGLTIRFTVTDSSRPPSPPATPWPIPDIPSSATTPTARAPERHAEFMARIRQGPVGLLFLGDSITDWWDLPANRPVYDAAFGRYSPANFGAASDQTQNVLWRITNGELSGINPRLVVLMIGTNNFKSNTDPEIASGVSKVVRTIRQRLPGAKVLLLGIFPREYPAAGWGRTRPANVNRELARLDGRDGKVRYMDVGRAFMRPDGTIGPDVMYDGLHLTTKGYRLWADAIRPTVDAMMK